MAGERMLRALCLVLAMTACDDQGTADVRVLRPTHPVEWRSGSEDSSAWIGDATGFTVRDEVIAVVDPARPAIHVLNRPAGEWIVVGQRGGGPAGFQSPRIAAVVGNEVWVTDTENQRLVWLSMEGHQVRSQRVQAPLYFAQSDDLLPVVRALDEEHLLELVSPDTTRYVGEVDELPEPFQVGPEVFHQPNFISLQPIEPGRFLIAENETGTLWVATLSGSRLSLDEIPVPPRIREAAAQRKEELQAAYGGWAPIYGRVHFDGHSHVWVRPIPMGVLGFLADLETLEVVSIVLESDNSIGKGLVDSVLRADTLFVLKPTRIEAYRVERTR